MHDFQHAFHTLFVSTVIWAFCDLQTGGIQKRLSFCRKGWRTVTVVFYMDTGQWSEASSSWGLEYFKDMV